MHNLISKGKPGRARTGRPLKTVFPLINERTRNAVVDPVSKVLQSGAVVGLANHTVLIARDGREIPIDDSAAPIRLPNGELFGVVLIFRDITQQRQAEHTRAWLAGIIDSSDDAIVSKRLDGTITADWVGTGGRSGTGEGGGISRASNQAC
jgi:PAS fold